MSGLGAAIGATALRSANMKEDKPALLDVTVIANGPGAWSPAVTLARQTSASGGCATQPAPEHGSCGSWSTHEATTGALASERCGKRHALATRANCANSAIPSANRAILVRRSWKKTCMGGIYCQNLTAQSAIGSSRNTHGLNLFEFTADKRCAHTSSSTPAAIIGSESHCPIDRSSASNPRKWSGSRVNSTPNRKTP